MRIREQKAENRKQIVLAKGEETVLVKVDKLLTKPNATFENNLIVIAQDTAKVTVDAKIVIEREATNAKAVLKIEVLIVGGSPKVTILPHMEVKNSLAEARHSVSTVKLGDEALFYAKTRGLDQAIVKELLIKNVVEPFMAP